MKTSLRLIKAMVARSIDGLGLALFFFTLPIAAHAEAPKIGMNFLHARKMLILDGWSPIPAVVPEGGFIGIENQLIRSGVGEVNSCAIDKAACIFYYKRRTNCLKVETEGEVVNNMRIAHLSHTCPNR